MDQHQGKSDLSVITNSTMQLSDGGKTTQIKNFQDPANKNAMPIIDLIDTCAPGTINYQVVKTGSGLSEEVRFILKGYQNLCL